MGSRGEREEKTWLKLPHLYKKLVISFVRGGSGRRTHQEKRGGGGEGGNSRKRERG